MHKFEVDIPDGWELDRLERRTHLGRPPIYECVLVEADETFPGYAQEGVNKSFCRVVMSAVTLEEAVDAACNAARRQLVARAGQRSMEL